MKKKKYAVIGAGSGGMVIAGYLFLNGNPVSLYNRSEERIKYIKEHDYTMLFNGNSDKIKLDYIGSNLSRVIRNSDVIIIVITANGHSDIAGKIAPLLKDGQIILLVPGRTLGALSFNYMLNKSGCTADVIVAEASTLFFAARLIKPGIVEIKGTKKEVSVSALYSKDTDYIIDVLSDVFKNIIKADTYLETSFSNIGAIFHPVILLLNKERISRREKFNFYTDGVTEIVAQYIEKVDLEFKSIASAIGINTLSVIDWLNSRYGLPRTSISQMLISNPTYKDIPAPETLNHRYIWEDIPTGLVPMSLLGKSLGIETPTIDFLINEGSRLSGVNFLKEGRTLKKMGLSKTNLISELWDKAYYEEEYAQWN